MKKEKEETKMQKQSMVADTSIFARYIASILDINYRFVGEEPTDVVTSQYNKDLKHVLPYFGIEVIEIPRKCNSKGEIISASKVRVLHKERKFEEMKEIVPQTTIDYLRKM